MKILKAIGGAIWNVIRGIARYISQNAWIQPILMVALIFALIFSLTAVPDLYDKVKNCKDEEEENTKIKVSTKLSNVSALTKQMEINTGDFIIILGEPTCSNCQNLYELLNGYQKNVGKISTIYYFDVTDLIEDLNDKDTATHDTALSDLALITDKIVDTYLEQQTKLDVTWPKLSSDSTKPWFQEQNFISRPTTLFYKDGVLWSVVLGTWTNSVTDYSKCNEIITAWKNNKYEDFAKIFNYK